jgi:glycosyltransferase involved in cell wall biosynthesis
VKACLLVPIYNHRHTIGGVLHALAYLGLPCLVIDDGSDAETRGTLDDLARELPWVEVLHLPSNVGRGAALRHGYAAARRQGFSHTVQLDADGQHEPGDVPRFLEAAGRAPAALILGAPQFDHTAPRGRLYGRQISRACVWIETLSLAIGDPLCGFRCVPLEPTMRLLARIPTGDRMEFDAEIAVRLFWEGVAMVNVPTRVRYFADGLSHFRLLRDNVLMSRLHIGLLAGMLRRLPTLLPRALGRPA